MVCGTGSTSVFSKSCGGDQENYVVVQWHSFLMQIDA